MKQNLLNKHADLSPRKIINKDFLKQKLKTSREFQIFCNLLNTC